MAVVVHELSHGGRKLLLRRDLPELSFPQNRRQPLDELLRRIVMTGSQPVPEEVLVFMPGQLCRLEQFE